VYVPFWCSKGDWDFVVKYADILSNCGAECVPSSDAFQMDCLENAVASIKDMSLSL
jgi:hypothetical protein